MPNQQQSPALAGTSAPGLGTRMQGHSTTRRAAHKWERVLRAFLAGRTLNRWDAVRELNDWCLHTTVSYLQGLGLVIDREDEVVPGYAGHPTHCKRYRLNSQSRHRACELLELDGERDA